MEENKELNSNQTPPVKPVLSTFEEISFDNNSQPINQEEVQQDNLVIPNISLNPEPPKIIEPVVASQPEPTSVKQKSPIGMIIMFILIMVVVFFLPEITSYVNNMGKIPEQPKETSKPIATNDANQEEDIEYTVLDCKMESFDESDLINKKMRILHYNNKVRFIEEEIIYTKSDTKTYEDLQQVCTLNITNYDTNKLKYECLNSQATFIERKVLTLKNISDNKIESLDKKNSISIAYSYDMSLENARKTATASGYTCNINEDN